MDKSRTTILFFICLSLSLVACQNQGIQGKDTNGTERIKTKQENELQQVEGESIPPEVDLAIKKMEEREIGKEYTRVHQYYFDETVLHILYERKLGDGWTDAFDFYDVLYDTEKLALESLTHKGEEHNFKEKGQLISEQKARKIANTFLRENGRGKVEKTKKTTAIERTHFIEEIQGAEIDYQLNQEKKIHRVYSFFNNDLEIYIDAYTGEIIGGDFFSGEEAMEEASDP